MIGAAYAYRRLALPTTCARCSRATWAATRSPCGHACIADPGCYNNLKLVDALAVLAITARSPLDTGERASPAEATRIVNERIPQVVDYGLRAQVGGRSLTATVLSDPGGNQIAYHALSTLMLAEAVDQLGAAASPGARRALRGTLDALSVLAGPDGEADYFGRGQGNVWVPAATAAAMIEGAALVQATDPGRAARYLAVAHAALARLRRLHLTPDRGLLVVPGVRTSYDGIDFYVHTVAYNGLAMWALALAADRAAALAPATGEPPAWGRLDAVDPAASGLAVVSTGRTWLAVRSVTNGDNHDLRNSFGLLALKVREPSGWRDLLAPRPRTTASVDSPGPVLWSGGRHALPRGVRAAASGAAISVHGIFRIGARSVRGGVSFRYRARPGGADLAVSPVRRGDRYRLLVFVPAGTGSHDRRTLNAFGARWGFSEPIAVRRLPGYHSAPIEQLDALEVVVRMRHAGVLRVRRA